MTQVRFAKNPNVQQRPGSLIKLLNALVMNDWASGAALDTVVSVTSADMVNWATNSHAQLQVGDQLSYRDLLFGMMLPSGNDAAKCIARNVGALIIAGGGPGSNTDPYTRYVQAMGAKVAALGMANTVVADPFGVDMGNLSTAADMAKAMWAYSAVPYLVTVSGAPTHLMTVLGANARTYMVTHTINPAGAVPLPEYICGKTGTVYYEGNNAVYDSGGCIAVLWETPVSHGRRITVVLGADRKDPQRYRDVRALIDYELAIGEP